MPQGSRAGPHSLYGEGFERAWQHRGKRVNERVQSFDHCFCSPKSVSLLAAGGGDQVRRQVAAARAEALNVGIGYLERHGIGVPDHNGTDRHQVSSGLLAVAFEHRMSRAGDPNAHTHVLVQNAAYGPDGRLQGRRRVVLEVPTLRPSSVSGLPRPVLLLMTVVDGGLPRAVSRFPGEPARGVRLQVIGVLYWN